LKTFAHHKPSFQKSIRKTAQAPLFQTRCKFRRFFGIAKNTAGFFSKPIPNSKHVG
jgi:hypothetical protein